MSLLSMCVCVCLSLLQALQHGFLDFEVFNVEEYEHYEVTSEDVSFRYVSDIAVLEDSSRPLAQHFQLVASRKGFGLPCSP